ncbi:MAG: protein translocase subunit SecF [Candidatus Eisenbacteria bacterium]|nr:protein translocase subunit SecF [Candidatus Eisenbacteria bacterium]
MFQIISQTNYRFMSYRKQAFVFSLILLFAGFVGWLLQGGFNLGIDFAGGLHIEFLFNQELPIEEVRATVEELGYSGAEIQDVGGNPRDLMIRIPEEGARPADEQSPSAQILDALQQKYPDLEGDLRMEEAVGPKIGSELRRKATLAVLISLLGILIYITVRFEVKFAVAAVLALFHDVIITLGVFAVLQREITLPVIAALLTIGGYSVNDTIVVFDRIREQLKIRRHTPLVDVINLSVNQVLSRTIITSMTTLFAVLALFFLGGQVIHDFSLAMLVGVLIGTYSSVFVASSTVLGISNLTQRPRRTAARRARASA